MIMSESVPPTRVKVPAGQYMFVVLLVAASIGYSVVCVVALTAVGSLRSLSAQVLAGQHPDATTVQERLRAVSHTATAVNGLGLLVFFSFLAWLVLLNRRYRSTGRRLPIGRLPAYALSVAWIVSMILSAAAGLGFAGIRTVADVHRAATIDMTFLAVRAAVGIVYAWCALALLAARRRWEPPPPPPAGSDLPYEEYVAMRAAQRAAMAPLGSNPALAPASTSPTEATRPAPVPPSASAGEMTSDATSG